MRICGMVWGTSKIIVDTGATLSEVPITISKSHCFLSCSQAEKKYDGRRSPKKTMSGFITPVLPSQSAQYGTVPLKKLGKNASSNFCL